MRTRFAIVPVLILALSAIAAAQEDVIAKALKDELDRSMKQLQLEKLDKPYFIAYRVAETEGRSASASFGALVSSGRNRSRTLRVEVRVGGYTLDNTNFFSPAAMAGANAALLPLEDDYKEIRRQIWLATDAAYKRALEDLSRKRAALQNKTRTDETPDFSQEPVASLSEEGAPAGADPARVEGLVRRLSALFREMSGANTSHVSLSVSNQRTWYVDSEGRVSKRLRPAVSIYATASAQAADGTPLEQSFSVHRRAFDELPAEAELARRIREMGERLQALRAAATLENYNGPVLFEGDAAPELFARIFVPNLLATRRPVTDGQAPGFRDNPFIDKLGARVLPEFLGVTDSPGLTAIGNQPLLGGMKVDDQGVPAQETSLVEQGLLKTLLTTRNPVRRVEHSNGHFRMLGPSPTNLIVSAQNGLSAPDLREKFLGLLKSQGKDFGVVVRSVGGGVQAPGSADPALALILAYKVFPDGKEELLRGVEVSGLSASTFKEILAVSKDQNVLTTGFRGGGMATGSIGFPSDRVVSFAVPSLLFEDVTVKKIGRDLPKPPVAKHPFFDR